MARTDISAIPAHIRRLAMGDPPARSILFVGIRAALAAPVTSFLSHFRVA
jgi:hypothetical protein